MPILMHWMFCNLRHLPGFQMTLLLTSVMMCCKIFFQGNCLIPIFCDITTMMTKKLSLSHKTVGKTTMVTTEKNLNILIWISICSFQHLKYFFSGPIANLSGSLFCADEGKTNNTWRGGNNLLWWPTSVFHLITMIMKYDTESYSLFLFICFDL